MSAPANEGARHAQLFPRRPVLLDGGVGTELMRAGGSGSLELLNVERPALVRSVHEAFRAAGADWLTTNTFRADPASLAESGLAERGPELVRAAVRLCREAAGGAARVLASVGPGPGGVPDAEPLREHLARLVDEGVDGLLIETQVEGAVLDALLAAVERVRAARGQELFVAVSLVADVHGALPAAREHGEGELLARLAAGGVDLLGLNCGSGPGFGAALQRVRDAWSGRLGAWPNAGVPTRAEDGALVHPVAPEAFARELRALERACDLDLIGGCCGCSPAHLAALAAR